MPLGVQQNNDFTQFTMDVWNDKIFYQEKEFPAGFMAMSILNIPEEDLPELIQAGGAPTFLFPVVVQGSDEEAAAVFPQLRERILYLTELLWKYPPFCYNDYEKEMRRINILFDERNLLQIRTPDSEFQTEFLRFCVGIIRIPIAMYHFYAAGRFFELDYLRRLKKRNETHFAVAAHDCFNSEQFWDEMRSLQSLDMEPFTVYRTLFCVRQLGDDVFSVSCGGDPAVAYDRLVHRMLLMQRMEEVLTPRELNLVRSYLAIGQPDEAA